MKIIYELNPPKILYGSTIDMKILNQEIEKFLQRARIISQFTNFIHITDSVLGIPRISSIYGAQLINNSLNSKKIKLSCSVRTRDRNINSIIQLVTEAVFLRVQDLLFIMGDKPQVESSNKYNNPDISTSLSKPTDVVNLLNTFGYTNLINFNLSIPNKITNTDNFLKKINSNPHGVITQSVSSLQEIKNLIEMLEPYSINLIPCIMIPSEKNLKAAKMIGLDWTEYKNNVMEILHQTSEIVDQILITSPNSFNEGIEILKNISS